MLDSMFIDSFADSYINVDLGLYGGFFGWELRRCERDPEANETVMHGSTTVKHGLTVGSGLTSATVIDGFTIRDYTEGAIDCSGSSPVISGNKITDNVGTAIVCGGAGQTPLIENNAVLRNDASPNHVGGVYSSGASPVITGNEFEDNVASDLGGAVYCYGGSPTITCNTFSENSAIDFGAGGAIACLWSDGQVLIDRNVLEGNGGLSCDHGGAITLHYCHSAIVSNSLFVGNHAAGYFSDGGGAVHSIRTPYSSGGPPLLLRNNSFVENWLALQDPPQPNSLGGAVHVRERSATVVNCVFLGNSAADGNSVAASEGASVTVSHCDAYTGDGSANYYSDQASTLIWTGLGNLFTDPDFCLSGTSHPCWLDQNSPLRGAGDPNVVPVGDLDLDGRPRPGPDGVDIGAYEDNPQCQ